jgi:hypothetical protein
MRRSNRRHAREEEPVGALVPCHGGVAHSRGQVGAAQSKELVCAAQCRPGKVAAAFGYTEWR